ncbi:acyl carrier protein [Amycolatopsis azurea]|uniref:Carrier domain-containing protein n=1 Tax=Amycolatopsis azurea DSM 43854 TaxID=1238180 RepID=M2PVG2_9PSEU|nr:acyl carrier protein [Amycolatopsis azurea]EMD28613.1 hypothetical protein C791_0237 [Amycolatopsis azurea DSM 43854]OOC08050.1 hypothetical protein B0293_03975 [Amycolatopsis azurea DSM 43854]
MINETETTAHAAIARRLTAWVVELVPGCDESALEEDTSLTDFAGFDSIAIVQLLAKAEEEFGVDLADQDQAIESANSIGSLAESIVRLGGKPR